jgi:hypothetical protein
MNGNSCVPATVRCGTGSCAIGNGQMCCATGQTTNASATYTCLASGQTCSESSFIKCNSIADCPVGQICCDKGYSYGYTNMWEIGCTTPAACDGGLYGFEFQVCDPNLSPSECAASGTTCKSSPTGIPGQYVCQP